MDKRQFLRTSAQASLGILLGDKLWTRYANLPAERLAAREDFWDTIRSKYRLKPDYINLESGYYSIQAQPVLEAFIANVRKQNEEGAYYLRTRQVPDKAAARDRLATLAGCDPGELIITRNTTESLDTVMNGYDWKQGDEAVMAVHDYPHMLAQFRLLARRYGIVNKVITVPIDPKSDDEIVQLYANAITPKTRLLMACHIINITGQILPVRKIADMAHSRGVDVMIDGAHAFAHIDYRIPDTGADYYGASLHKWLGVPLGSGLLYIRKDKIQKLWPIFGDNVIPADVDNVMKLNHTGTHPVHTDLTIGDAIDFHNMIGTQRKEARLRFLQNYWTSKVRGKKNIALFTPSDPKRSCAIANVGVTGVAPADLAKTLFDKYKIFCNAVNNAGITGVRITPHVFIQPRELDVLVTALGDIASHA